MGHIVDSIVSSKRETKIKMSFAITVFDSSVDIKIEFINRELVR